MNAPEPRCDWTDANQRALVAEIARLKARLRGEDETAALTALAQARAGTAGPGRHRPLGRALRPCPASSATCSS